MKQFIFSALLIFPFVTSLPAGEVPFTRGINLSTWMEQSSARQIQFTKYTKKDFQNIKSLGCDVIRLPIAMHNMTSGSPDYIIDPILFDFLDEAVNWAEELGLHIILDNHSFDPAVNTQPNVGIILAPVWKQMAAHYKDRSSLVYYEILNEPHGINDYVWNTVQQMVIDSIRAVDTKHTIIIGPAGWNSYNNLNAMPVYPDTNLIYTFHFYDPFIFTHQGADWASPSMVPLAGIPFPYDAARMPVFPAVLNGTYYQNDYNNYGAIGTAANVKKILDIAVNFQKNRNVRLYCGEFGAFDRNSINEDRVRYYQVVRSYLEEKGIAWTSWDYQGGFGIFKKNTSALFDYDLNIPLLTSLGFTVPPQKIFTMLPESTAIEMYTDYFGPNTVQSSYGSGIDLYASGPFSGKYCINWKNGAQYDRVGFDFVPDKDLSVLKNNGYWLQIRVKSSSPGLKFDVRFLDTKNSPSDHPWRMSSTVTGLNVSWDGNWHTYSIQLKNMSETGSWDSTWYNPAGLFDWKAVDRFEIVAEQASLTGKELWLDDIRIVSSPASVSGTLAVLPKEFGLDQNFPNPFNPSTTIQYNVPRSSHVTLRIFNVLGQNVATLVDGTIEAGSHSTQWTADVSAGIYLCRMESGTFVQTRKLLLVK